MQNILNTQKSISSNRSVLAYSEVTSAKKSGGLGTSTKSCSNIDFKREKNSSDYDKRQSHRSYVYALRDRASDILHEPKKLLKEQHRVCACGKHKRDADDSVSVSVNASTGVATYQNLIHCGSVWVCPSCSFKISQERKKELAEAMKSCRSKGLHVAMLTLTAPHYMGDNIKELLKNMGKAKHSLWTNRNSRDYFKSQMPLVGHITATEVKYSDNNGFHPHYHILLILDKQYKAEDLEIIESDLYEFWSEKCVKQGLGKPNREHGIDLKMGSNAEDMLADYISKWGLAEEMTQAHMKVGKRNSQSLTMWEVLDLSQLEVSTRDKYSHIFRIYSKAFKGRRQLFWSKGLKKLLSVADTTDEELANKEEPEEAQMISAVVFTNFEWSIIRKFKLQAKILNLIESDFMRYGIDSTFESARYLLNDLKTRQGFLRGQGETFPCS
jgi:hypothetical protein